jgi:hypothetical protein
LVQSLVLTFAQTSGQRVCLDSLYT